MKTLLFILQILPALIDVLKAIEASFPAAGKGAEKLALVKQVLEQTYPAIEEMWPVIEKVISVLVGWFNNMEVFKKG